MVDETRRTIPDAENLSPGKYGLEITRASNGFLARDMMEGEETVFEEREEDGHGSDESLDAIESLLWFIIEYFGKGGSKYSKERLRIDREPGEKYE